MNEEGGLLLRRLHGLHVCRVPVLAGNNHLGGDLVDGNNHLVEDYVDGDDL